MDDSIQKHVLLLAPICIDNEEIKEKEGEELLQSEEAFSVFHHKECLFRGLPIESNEFVPLIMLIPHLRA